MELPFKVGDRLPDVRLGTLGGTSRALHDYRGRKTLVYVWASWCGCREYLDVLQKFHLKHSEANVVSIACDVQGPARPMQYLKKAGASYEMLIDATCTLARRWGLKRVSVGILLDEEGRVMTAGERLDEEFLAQVEKLLPEKPEKGDDKEPKVDTKNTQIEVLMQSCTNFLGRGRKDDAVAALKKALELDPENKVVPKQIWAIQHPDKFYAGPIDKAWQKKQT